jgi:hypothetical protein
LYFIKITRCFVMNIVIMVFIQNFLAGEHVGQGFFPMLNGQNVDKIEDTTVATSPPLHVGDLSLSGGNSDCLYRNILYLENIRHDLFPELDCQKRYHYSSYNIERLVPV